MGALVSEAYSCYAQLAGFQLKGSNLPSCYVQSRLVWGEGC